MINVERLRKKPRHFHHSTGLTPEQFDELYARVEKAFDLLERERLGRKERRRNIGGGRKYQACLKGAVARHLDVLPAVHNSGAALVPF